MDAPTVLAVWTTELLVALVAGLFGLVTGASAAAVITTNHERNERFRTRMIESAEQVVVELNAVRGLLASALRHAEGLVSIQRDWEQKVEAASNTSQVLDKAGVAKDRFAANLARLMLIHPDPRVRILGPELAHVLDVWFRFTELAVEDFQVGASDEMIIKRLEYAVQRERYAEIYRDRLHEIFPDEIFGYGTFGYWWRQRSRTLKREAKLLPQNVERTYQSRYSTE
jgi:hypothetical protein